MNYEKGLKILKEIAETQDSQTISDFDLYHFELVADLYEKSRQGGTDTIRDDINRIIEQLNSLARRLTGKSFVSLCEESVSPLYNFSTPDSFDLDALITRCRRILSQKKQGLVGFAINCNNYSFLKCFKTRLKKDALGREKIFAAEPLKISHSHCPPQKCVELASQYIPKLSKTDVLVDVSSDDKVAATGFWESFTNVFSSEAKNRFIIIMALTSESSYSESSYPQGLIPLTLDINEDHVFEWTYNIVSRLSLLPPDKPDVIANDWTDTIMNQCSYNDKLDVDKLYIHLDLALDELKTNSTVPAICNFIKQQRK